MKRDVVARIPAESEIVIAPNGEVAISFLSGELLDLAYLLAPKDENIARRWERKNISAARKIKNPHCQ